VILSLAIMKPPLLVAIAAGAALFAGAAHAQEPPPSSEPAAARAGLFARIAGGLGYGAGRYRYTDHPANATSGPTLTLRDSFAGVSVDVSAALGYAVVPGFAAAFEAGASMQPELTKPAHLAWTTIDGVFLGRFGVLFVGYPLRDAPYQMELGLHYTTGAWAGATATVGAPNNIIDLEEAPAGFDAHLAVGYVLHTAKFDLVPMLRAYGATLHTEHSRAEMYGLELVFGATRF
jgi:hypothetical protein